MAAIAYKFTLANGPEIIAGLAKCAILSNHLETRLAPPKPACECGAELHPGVPHEEALAAEQRT